MITGPKRIDILRVVDSKGPQNYSDLKSFSGFHTQKEGGKFAYHLRRLLRQSLVAFNRSKRLWKITNLGKVVLDLTERLL